MNTNIYNGNFYMWNGESNVCESDAILISHTALENNMQVILDKLYAIYKEGVANIMPTEKVKANCEYILCDNDVSDLRWYGTDLDGLYSEHTYNELCNIKTDEEQRVRIAEMGKVIAASKGYVIALIDRLGANGKHYLTLSITDYCNIDHRAEIAESNGMDEAMVGNKFDSAMTTLWRNMVNNILPKYGIEWALLPKTKEDWDALPPYFLY